MRSICPIYLPTSSNNIPKLNNIGFYNTSSNCTQCIPTQSYNLYTNVTQVPNYSGSGNISPYARPDPFDAPNCGDYYGYVCGPGNGNKECYIPYSSSVDVGSANVHLKKGYYQNGFNNAGTASIQTKDSKENTGFKVVYANKAWHGTLPYNSSEHFSVDTFQDWCCACPVKKVRTSPETVHYLDLNVTSNTLFYYNQKSSDPDIPDTIYKYTGEASGAFSVNKYSGNYTQANCTSASAFTLISGDVGPDSGLLEYYAGQALSLLAKANGNINDLFTYYCLKVAVYDPTYYNVAVTGGGGGGSWHVNITLTDSGSILVAGNTNFSGYTWVVYDINLNSSYNFQQYGLVYNVNGVPDIIKTFEENINVTDTGYHYDAYYASQTFLLNSTYTISMDGILSNPYTSGQVKDDAVNLLSHFPLSDDLIYPWRCDGRVNEGPLVTYNEKSPQTVDVSCGTSTSSLHDGSILGEPLPFGYDKWWNPRHENWKVCTDDSSGLSCTIKYIDSYGAWSTDSPVASATQWINEYQKHQLFQGAFIGNGFFWTTPTNCSSANVVHYDNSMIWVAKYAELIEPKESFDYTRPCGADRLTISESSGRCVVNVSSSAVNLEPTGTPTPLNTGDYAWLCGTGNNDGLWIVTKINNYKIGLTTFIASASLFPTQPVESCGTGVIGKLKYTWNSSKAICGYVPIQNITNATPITCSLQSATYLVNTDNINISNETGIGINGNWSIKVIDNKNFALVGSTYQSGSPSFLIGTGLAYTDSNAAYSEVSPKGDFVSVDWGYNFRDVGEYYRLAAQYSGSIGSYYDCAGTGTGSSCPPPAVTSNPRTGNLNYGVPQEVNSVTCTQRCYNASGKCAGSTIAYFSPTTESFDNVNNSVVYLGWFSNYTVDGFYGALEQGFIKQYDRDYLFTAPPCVCGQDNIGSEEEPIIIYDCICTNKEDDGTCLNNTATPCINYYAMPNLIENRCSIPSGSVYNNPYVVANIGCLSVEQMNSGATGNACPPPNNNGALDYQQFKTNLYMTPYCIIYNNKKGCVCADGRFANTYYSQGIFCEGFVDLLP